MIESCSRKQMIIAIICLIGLSIIVVVVENLLTPSATDGRHRSDDALQDSQASNLSLPENCWRTETFTLLEDCQPCSDLELKVGSPSACLFAHYRQKVKCLKTGVVYRRCDRAVWLEERHFLIFMLSSFAIAAAGATYTSHRHNTLQERVLSRISQQLAAGV